MAVVVDGKTRKMTADMSIEHLLARSSALKPPHTSASPFFTSQFSTASSTPLSAIGESVVTSSVWCQFHETSHDNASCTIGPRLTHVPATRTVSSYVSGHEIWKAMPSNESIWYMAMRMASLFLPLFFTRSSTPGSASNAIASHAAHLPRSPAVPLHPRARLQRPHARAASSRRL